MSEKEEGEATCELFAKLKNGSSTEELEGRPKRRFGREGIGIEREDELEVGSSTHGCELARLVLRSRDLGRKFVEILRDDDEVFGELVGWGRRKGWRWTRGGSKWSTRFGVWRGELDAARRSRPSEKETKVRRVERYGRDSVRY